MDYRKRPDHIIVREPSKLTTQTFDYKTLQQVIQEAEETRRRSIEIQDTLCEFLRRSEKTTEDDPKDLHRVKANDLVRIGRGKDEKVTEVSILKTKADTGLKPKADKASPAGTGVHRLEIQPTTKSVTKKLSPRPKTVAANPKIRTAKKIPSSRSLKDTKTAQKPVRSSIAVPDGSKPKIKAQTKSKRASNDSSRPKSAQQKNARKIPVLKKVQREEKIVDKDGSVDQRKSQADDRDETSRPGTAMSALRKSKELLDAIGRRDKLTGVPIDVKAYLNSVVKRD